MTWEIVKSRYSGEEVLKETGTMGRFIFGLIEYPGLSIDAEPIRRTLVAAPDLLASLRAILPYAESRAEDMLDDVTEYAEGGTLRAEAKAAADKAVAAVEAAKALLASLDG